MFSLARSARIREVGLKLKRSGWPVFLALLFHLPSGVGAAVAAAPNDLTGLMEELFAPEAPVLLLRITIPQTNQVALFQDPKKFVTGTVEEGGRTYTDVAIHLKGQEGGSFRPLHEKPAMTLNFDRVKKGQLFHGLDKIYLNNSVEDETYMTEILCGELFRAAGVPNPRATYVRVEFSGRDRGVYILKEGYNKRFLRRHFRNPDGNFYEGGLVTDIDEPLVRSSGDGPADNADLKALVAAARIAEPASRWQALERVLSINRFLTFMAMEVITGHLDGYTMNRNNYRIYHDPGSRKMIFLPHGMDIMFSDPDGPLEPYMDGLVARAIIESPEGRRRYRERIGQLFTNVFKMEAISNHIDVLQARIRPLLVNSGGRRAAADHDEAVEQLRRVVVQRGTNLALALSTPEPKPLVFDAGGKAPVLTWYPRDEDVEAKLNYADEAGVRRALYIGVGESSRCSASWRTAVVLHPGRYRFEAMLRTRSVLPMKTSYGEGAGIRVSRMTGQRPGFSADTDWKSAAVEFTIGPELEAEEVELICELLASAGEVWFDPDALRLVRISSGIDPRAPREKPAP